MAEVKAVLPEADPHYDPARREREIIVTPPAYDGDFEHTGGRPEPAGASSPATV
jgi:hypothetical protein